jgi:hypothetical protein
MLKNMLWRFFRASLETIQGGQWWLGGRLTSDWRNLLAYDRCVNHLSQDCSCSETMSPPNCNQAFTLCNQTFTLVGVVTVSQKGFHRVEVVENAVGWRLSVREGELYCN